MKIEDYPLINLDWVAFSVLLIPNPQEKDAHAFTLNDISAHGFKVLEYSGTNIYSRRAIVYDCQGEKLLTLLFSPHSRILDFRSCLVEIANPLLYLKRFPLCGIQYGELLWVPELLQLLHPYQMQCLSRIDIACDFELLPERARIIRQLAYDEVYVQRYRDGVSFHEFAAFKGSKVERVIKQLSWGSKHSNLKWKVYNKSLEVFDFVKTPNGYVRHCSKPYIVDRWRARGWNIENVWRLEVSICPMEKYRFHGQRLYFKSLSNWFVVSDLFISLYMSKFVTRLNQGHTDRSNDTRVYLIGNLGEVDKITLREASGDKVVVEYVNALRAAMQQLEKPEVTVNAPMLQLWTETAKRCVEIGNLGAYFLNTYGYPVTELANHLQRH